MFLIFSVFCVVFLFYLSSSCVLIVTNVPGLSILDLPFGFLFSFVKCKRSVTEIFIFISYIYTIVIGILLYYLYYGDMSYLQAYKVFENIAYILYLTDILMNIT